MRCPALPRENILAEPTGRNTAPCIGWACDPRTATFGGRHPGGYAFRSFGWGIAVGFVNAMTTAVSSAEKGVMTTFGIVPDRPETGFGYIETGEEISPSLFLGKTFCRKTGFGDCEAISCQRQLSLELGHVLLFTRRVFWMRLPDRCLS